MTEPLIVVTERERQLIHEMLKDDLQVELFGAEFIMERTSDSEDRHRARSIRTAHLHLRKLLEGLFGESWK